MKLFKAIFLIVGLGFFIFLVHKVGVSNISDSLALVGWYFIVLFAIQFAWYTLIMMALGYEVAMAVKVVIHAEKPAPLLAPSEVKINTSGKAKGLPSRQVRNVTAADYLAAMGRPLETLPEHNGLRDEYSKHLAMLAQQDADRDANELAKVQVHAAWMQPSKVLEVCRERLQTARVFEPHALRRVRVRNVFARVDRRRDVRLNRDPAVVAARF